MLTTQLPLELLQWGDHTMIRLPPQHFYAKITGNTLFSGTYKHSWEEVQYLADGDWETMPNGRTGTENAFELSNKQTETDTIVQIWGVDDGFCFAAYGALSLVRSGTDASVSGLTLYLPYAAGVSSNTFTQIPDVSTNTGGILTDSRQTIGGTKIFSSDIIAYSGIQWFKHDVPYPFLGSGYTMKAKIDVGGYGGAWMFKRWGNLITDDDWVEFHLQPSDGIDPTRFGIRDNYSGNGTQLVLWDTASTTKEGASGTDLRTNNKYYGGIIYELGSNHYIDFLAHYATPIPIPPTDTFRLHNANGTFGYFDDTGTFFPIGGMTDKQVQDSIGGILDNGTAGQVNFTYDDATPLISGVIKDGSVTKAQIDSGAGFTGTL